MLQFEGIRAFRARFSKDANLKRTAY
jgi:hypothetical protein